MLMYILKIIINKYNNINNNNNMFIFSNIHIKHEYIIKYIYTYSCYIKCLRFSTKLKVLIL